MTSAKYTLLILLSVFVSALSQILLKKSALKSYKSRIFEYLNPLVIMAYIMFFGAVCIDLVALRFVPVSFVPVIETSSYIFVMLLGRLVFKERISKKQLLSMALIITGIFIYVS